MYLDKMLTKGSTLQKKTFFGMAAIIIEKAPKSLHLIKENFFGTAVIIIEVINLHF